MNALRTATALTPIPDAVLSQHIAILGKTRSGKSSVARLMVEGLLDAEKPVCIVDPKGDWWGLKSSANGKKAGYPVIIFGGEHADVPINAHSGAHVAELIATGNRPCIIDLGGWMVGERTRFFIDFASTLFKLTRGMRYLVVDECHNFCPQGKVLDPDAGKMLHWANRLASEGAGKGITLISLSQRPQKVHKDYLTSHETLIAMRVIHPLDRGAIKDWIDGCGDPAIGKEVLSTLAGMQRGEGWVWSPEVGFGPERVQFPLFKTYDSFKARDTEHAETLQGWATVDLDDVRSKLATVVEEAAKNDPKILRAEIAKLQKDLASKPGEKINTVDPAALEAARSEGFDDGYVKGVQAIRNAVAQKIAGAFTGIDDEVLAITGRLVAIRKFTSLDNLHAIADADLPKPSPNYAPKYAQPKPTPVAQPVEHRSLVSRVAGSSPAGRATPSGDLSGPQRQLLEALAWWLALGHRQPSRAQVAAVAGWRVTSGHLKNIAGSLRSLDLVSYPADGLLALTAAGEKAAPAPDTDSTVVERIRAILSGPQRQVFDALLTLAYTAHGAISREGLASALGWSAESGHLKNVVGSMRSLEIVTYPQQGHVALADWIN